MLPGVGTRLQVASFACRLVAAVCIQPNQVHSFTITLVAPPSVISCCCHSKNVLSRAPAAVHAHLYWLEQFSHFKERILPLTAAPHPPTVTPHLSLSPPCPFRPHVPQNKGRAFQKIHSGDSTCLLLVFGQFEGHLPSPMLVLLVSLPRPACRSDLQTLCN